MKILFLKDWHDDLEHWGGNFDGILGAIAELSKRHDLTYVTRGNLGKMDIKGIKHVFLPSDDAFKDWVKYNPFEVVISWGSLDRPWNGLIPLIKANKKYLCFAGGPTKHDYLKHFNHVFVESTEYQREFENQGVSVSKAFGTNTKIFRLENRTTRIFEAIYPASFCFHKRLEFFASVMGSKGLLVGAWNVPNIVAKCLQLGTPVMRRVSSEVLCDLYNMSWVTLVTCGNDGGSQRTVLESMACGVPVVVTSDNEKCAELVHESDFGEVVHPVDWEVKSAVEDLKDQLVRGTLYRTKGIDYINSKWTESHYAEAIERVICPTKSM